MIKASRLFLVPSLSMFLLIIPYGIILTFLILIIWYSRNQEDIHAYFKGREYRQEEASDETIKEFQ